MYKKISCIVILWLSIIQISYSQTLKGQVFEDQTPLPGALVRVLNEQAGGLTNQNGEFSIKRADNTFPIILITTYIGYKTDTLTLSANQTDLVIQLSKSADIDAVVVVGRDMATDIDPLSAQQLEVLGSKELLKAACCNLSESFENSATVDVSFSDAVTGSKQISMLGLAGVYTQINWENMPLVRGVGEYYGLSFVPGTWINSIQVGKGSGSVVNGYESMTGQINVEFHKPEDMDEFFINGFQNAQGRSELNLHGGKQISKNVSTGLFIHGNLLNGEPDGNNDGFMDRNKGGQINVMNRWKFVGKGRLRSQVGLKYLNDEKIAGQLGFNKGDTRESTGLYGVDVESNRVEVFGKSGVIFPEKPWKSLGLIVNGVNHKQDALFGIRTLESHQKSVYGNFIYQTMINNTQHKLKTGANFQYDHFDETLDFTATEREYSVPGVFAEYDYDNLKNLKIVAGIRGDYLNTTDDIEVSPRVHIKWNTDKENAIRLTAGRGFRAPNIYADAPAILINSREILLQEIPEIESSWNMGASITRYIKINGREATFVSDFYRTTFQNQVIRDFYTSPNRVIISNLDGESYANSFQTSLDYELFERFEVRMAYKRDDVKQDINGQKIERQLTPKHRGLFNIAYATNYDRWKIDATAQYTGEQRLPTTAITPDGLNTPFYSDDFWKINTQATTKVKDWEFYLGAENLTNFTQPNPIIAAENPFGNMFDASNVWGPIQGTNVYFGFRYSIKNKNQE